MNRVSKKNLLTSIFILLVLSIGIGYAYLTSNLSITGSTEIAANSWDIHFANLTVSDGSVSATTPAAITPGNNTEITYTVKLNRPKEFYEFTVDIVNDGSLPGKVAISTINGIPAQVENIVLYTITYVNGRPVNEDDILNGGTSKRIKVRVYYNDELDPEDLPDENINLTLTFSINYNQSVVDALPLLNDTLLDLSLSNSCLTKYEGEVTDQVGVTTTANNVYFDNCADKRNVIFGGYCWQIIRTTETGGTKMIYNGEPVDGKCESTRGDHKGIVGANGSTQSLASEYLYGSSFTYDTSNDTFTLVDTTSAIWSDSTYENLIGKFTCKNSNGTCSTLYVVSNYSSNTNAYVMPYTIGNTSYTQIGTSAFNVPVASPAKVGYMYNKVYTNETMILNNTNYKYGTSYTYDSNNNMYTLSGVVESISIGNQVNNDPLGNKHYTCWNDTGICSTISYIYNEINVAYYININDGKGINDALNEMFFADDVNSKNSSIKEIIDIWYQHNLLDFTNRLEDTAYCNSRNIFMLYGWSENLDISSSSLLFDGNILNGDLTCKKLTDQFAVGNNKAKLDYPVALLRSEEKNNITDSSLISTGNLWWTNSPNQVYAPFSRVRIVNSSGGYDHNVVVSDVGGVRPVISLKYEVPVVSGTGSETDPWVVE